MSHIQEGIQSCYCFSRLSTNPRNHCLNLGLLAKVVPKTKNPWNIYHTCVRHKLNMTQFTFMPLHLTCFSSNIIKWNNLKNNYFTKVICHYQLFDSEIVGKVTVAMSWATATYGVAIQAMLDLTYGQSLQEI